ncbi:MAG: hypothetical protein KC912_24170 [Proteobacteria bacterium]|nr:hypothetical protein [Pseudomonadota bacterium]
MRTFLPLFLAACTATEPMPETCNGWEALCERTLLEVTLPKTHNSHASLERDYQEAAANHVFPIPRQLEDGIRALNVDVYEEDDEMLACHGYCDLGSQPLSEVWDEITDFLDAHPREVIWLNLQDGAPLPSVLAAFEAAGMHERAYVHDGTWPTLGAMIEADTRLIIAGSGGGDEAPWYHNVRDLAFATNYGYESVDAMDCELRFAAFDGGLFELVHTFLDPIAWEHLSEEGNPALEQRAEDCQAELGFRPNLLSVDWHHHGDVVGVAARFNEVDPDTRQSPVLPED